MEMTMTAHRGIGSITVAIVLLMPGATAVSGETYILPVVVKGVKGLSGSYWDTEVRILRLSLQQDLVARRVWVALADGGSVDDPANAPTWSFPAMPPQLTARMIVLKGSDLLQGVNATHASIALDISGKVAVYLHNVNRQGTQDGALLGSGQLAPGASAPSVGPVTVPWVTAGKGNFRMSLGLVNPNPAPLTLRVYPSSLYLAFPYPDEVDWRYWLDANALQPLVVTLPPWGWRQLDDVFSQLLLCTYPMGCSIANGWGYGGPHYMEVEPDDPKAPYFAYASIVYSPLNDPEFVPVIPGSVEGAPRSPFPCPPDCSWP